ncbi:MAG: sugar phosphate isomerase/epimerase [Lewinellaceae bacterium]|nr:sugar phosphate isomerase/epimerase [Lewinellaceae bacterium]
MNQPPGLNQLCVHTITTKPWPLDRAVDAYQAEGIQGISVWQDAVLQSGLKQAAKTLEASQLSVVSYVRGGFFPHTSAGQRQKAIDHNKLMLEEAATIGAPLLVLVCGSDPAQSLSISRDQIREGLENILPYAESLGVKLGIEPLHPMYADTRSAINNLKTANDMADQLDHPYCGVVVDVYHLWWDPDLEAEIMRCGRDGHLFSYHICDWKVPTADMLNDRGLMGEGCIPLKKIRSWVERAGFFGFHEVEIFSNTHWQRDQMEFLRDVVHAFQHHS